MKGYTDTGRRRTVGVLGVLSVTGVQGDPLDSHRLYVPT